MRLLCTLPLPPAAQHTTQRAKALPSRPSPSTHDATTSRAVTLINVASNHRYQHRQAAVSPNSPPRLRSAVVAAWTQRHIRAS
jgi:hypothetical protein